MRSAWTLDFAPKAAKQLRKLDRTVAVRIVETLERDLAGHETPRDFGDALVGKFTGLWRYRIGDYRAIARIEDRVVTVFVIEVGHRSDVYR